MKLNIKDLDYGDQLELVDRLTDIVTTSEKAIAVLEDTLKRRDTGNGTDESIWEPFFHARNELQTATITAVALQLIGYGVFSS